MKKIGMFVLLLLVTACVEAGKFPENREKLHRMGTEQQQDYCKQNPDRCIKGIQW